jgi:NAD(P)H-dependent FMN reductase
MFNKKASTQAIRVALIYGSTREGRFCDKVAGWAAGEIALHSDFSLSVIDPAVLPFVSLREQIGEAEAFIVVTPEYNHSFPAPLKVLIDSVNEEWHAKPVAFISYGGISGGLRAVEHLRQVFAELHAVTVRDTVSFAHAWTQFDDTGKLRQPDSVKKSMFALLSRLQWWARALREAREVAPYSLARPRQTLSLENSANAESKSSPTQ